MSITHKDNYVAEARGRLLEMYKDKPRIVAFVTSLVQEVQDCEDRAWEVFVARLIQNSLAVFPVVITVSTTGVLGVMQFTYTIAGGPSHGPVVSAATWRIPGSAFFVAFADINYTSTAWTYTIAINGAVTPAGGAGADVALTPSDLVAKLGKLAGQNSLGYNDAQYMQFIEARIRVNHSNGLRTDLAAIIGFLVDTTLSADFFIKDFGPAAVMVSAYVSISPYIIQRLFLGLAVAAGVNLVFLWSNVAPAGTIMPGSIYDVEFSAPPPTSGDGPLSTQRMGSIYHAGFAAGPPVTGDGGGKLAGVVQTQG